jgi:hypothetical protein
MLRLLKVFFYSLFTASLARKLPSVFFLLCDSMIGPSRIYFLNAGICITVGRVEGRAFSISGRALYAWTFVSYSGVTFKVIPTGLSNYKK